MLVSFTSCCASRFAAGATFVFQGPRTITETSGVELIFELTAPTGCVEIGRLQLPGPQADLARDELDHDVLLRAASPAALGLVPSEAAIGWFVEV